MHFFRVTHKGLTPHYKDAIQCHMIFSREYCTSFFSKKSTSFTAQYFYFSQFCNRTKYTINAKQLPRVPSFDEPKGNNFENCVAPRASSTRNFLWASSFDEPKGSNLENLIAPSPSFEELKENFLWAPSLTNPRVDIFGVQLLHI